MAARDAVEVTREDCRLGGVLVCCCSVEGAAAGGSRRMDSGIRSASTSNVVKIASS